MEGQSGSTSGCARLQLHVNGKKVVVKHPDPNTVLADFLREDMGLKGLQIVCRQGGCGSCTVVVSSSVDGVGGAGICSCLMPLCSVDGMHVTTIEGLGSLRTGLSSLQKAIVDHNGTQCGYCTPGMIMSMYGLMVNKSQPSPQEIEDQIDGNICRCTGYRPILDAFQSACSADGQLSCSQSQNGHCANGNIDIEDISRDLLTRLVTSEGHAVVWIRACDLQDLSNIVRTNSGKKKVRLVRGNTSTAIYPSSDQDILVDISRIPTLLFTSVSSKGISIGGAVTIADLMLLLKNHRDLSKHYRPLYKILKLVANPQVRAVGSVAGNLMIVHQHREFISDIATILLAAEVQLTIYELCLNKAEETVDLGRFFEMDMKDKVISKIFLPALPVKTHFAARKIALRKANSQPIVTAACNIKVDPETDLVLPQPIIVYGGIKPSPQRAKKTENDLVGKHYRDPKVFSKCLSTLQQELVVDPSYDQSKYRSSLVNYFFYYFIISAYPKDAIPNNLLSIVTQIDRPISSGTISYGKGDPSEYPVSLPLPKKSAAAQTTGEVEYLDDLKFNSLHAAYVVASVSNAIIDVIDPSKALAADGVLAFLSAETITAYGYSNNVNESETVFASHEVQYHGQAIGLIVAVTKNIAKSAAEIVEVKYKDVKEPILTVEDALKSNSFFDSRSMDFCRGEVGNSFGVADLTVEGEVSVGHQYHFHLESQRALCIPGEEGCMTVYSSTQDPSQVQQCVSVALNRPQHKITVNVKRVGGAFGAKLNRATPIAMACAMAADIVQKPVRLVLDLGTNMKLIGGRSPHLCRYKASANKDGQITAVQMDIINNQGAHVDFEHPNMFLIGIFADGAYNIKNWRLKVRTAKTNLPPNTYIRGPMYVETAVMIETILEHISHELNLEPSVVRELNMYDKGDITILDQHLPDCNAKLIFHNLQLELENVSCLGVPILHYGIFELLSQESSDYFKRCADVKAFNEQNKWVKRGMSLVPVKFCAFWEKAQMISLLNIHTDASISIHQSGCEIGQGLDTKVAQAAAMALGTLVCDQICMEEIYVHTNTTIVSNNVQETGSSVTSELSVRCVLNACETLVKRLRAISNAISTSESKPTWRELIAKALSAGVDLQARGRSYPDVGPCGPFQYVAFAAAVTEVEVNILSGETSILRSDVLLDSGKSLNPAIDIGQLRGGFIQGLGYFLTEKYVHHKKTGKLITDGTATYKPPSSKDIPIIFNASLLPNSMNPYGVQRSKFSGEPPIASACSVFFAVRQAIAAAKSDGEDRKWFALNAPITVDQVALAANVSSDMLNVP